ncbi:type I-E CRISPR-associated protein Cse1/CasA [Streptomonospora wellingtoniae]|uniref:Type I-E CRISPR-associated protein Cse1/CasA n=1 Tax=Streptomonospora wellingtoniae TaxID=3075544 RepID=A0ABU2KNH9_9ACTN|nr:type I-E CRISPR-associated protein Cse1/CasA [Streptomonospora sp. DSM 45055]MDT0300831.1 type I-E CRISPR-associated protein Cse1/CasA [Streptomonospora sp. DSM 45055]
MALDPLFDLRTQPWVPVRWLASVPTGQRPARVGLRELLARAHEIAGLAVTVPPAEAGLLRVAYALTARTTRLDRAQGWSDRRFAVLDAGRFDPAAIDAYFDAHADRFWLYHPQWPFLQDPRLKKECPKTSSVDKLVATRPSGGNHAWFTRTDSHRPVPLDSGQALLHLLVWRYYGASGTCSTRAVDGTRAGNTTAGPLRSTLSYHPEGASLFETLLAGIPEPGGAVDPATDRCPWEWESLPDPLEAPPEITGPCSGLTARAQHALLLVPDTRGAHTADAYVTWAYRAKIARDDPFCIWQSSKEGNRYPRPADADRDLWRDLDALVLNDPPGASRPQRPAILTTATELLAETDTATLRIRALGFDQDGQAKDRQFVAASTPPLLDLMERRDQDIDAARQVGRLRLIAERAGYRLETATRRAWALYAGKTKLGDCAWAHQAAARYWSAAETAFWTHLRQRSWHEAAPTFHRLASEAYDAVTDTAAAGVRGARAREAARIELHGGRPKKTKEKKTS